MRRRRINLTKGSLPKSFVKIRRKYMKIAKKYYAPTYINEEYD
jgi:hypothetical protein